MIGLSLSGERGVDCCGLAWTPFLLHGRLVSQLTPRPPSSCLCVRPMSTTSLLQTSVRKKYLLLVAAAVGASLVWLLLYEARSSSASLSIGGSTQNWGFLLPTLAEFATNTNGARSGDAQDAAKDWNDPELPATPDIVSRRFAWTRKTYSAMDSTQINRLMSVPRVCVAQDSKSHNRHCFDEALVTNALSAPICLMDHIHIRSTFLYDGYAVSLVEVSNELFDRRNMIVFCPSGDQPLVKGVILANWVRKSFRVTHMNAFIKCPVRDGSSLNAQGLLFVNYHGDCTFSAASIASSFSNPKSTSLVMLTTPAHPSFQDAFPSLPARGNSFLQLPQVQSATKGISPPYQYSTCVMGGVLDTDAPFLTSWLWHLRHKMRVGHIVLYIVPEHFHFDSPNINATLVKEYLDDGFLTLVPWTSRYLNGLQTFYRSQHLAYNDYLYRFRGLCHWTLFADADDFFVNWHHDHQLAPFISEYIQQDPSIEIILLPWPLLLPQCQNVSGYGPPFDSNYILNHLQFGQLGHGHTKQLVATHNRGEVSIHSSPGKTLEPNKPGVAVYHVRAGPYPGIRFLSATKESCEVFELEGFNMEARKTLRKGGPTYVKKPRPPPSTKSSTNTT